ncbi:MAG: Gfo/Idh/MocA family oxidoreductase [Steroidobacteraceae bacterium]|jgi:predicted dehydrogenase|nr:Gfo/Idh/MocA family oxidoreductase [Steroidobacteraceae bacterium]
MTDLTFDRRAMLKTAGAAAVGLSAIATAAAPRRKYVIVGMGSRSRMYLTAITKTYQDGNELVAICDTNPGRLETAAKFVAANLSKDGGVKPKKYLAADFDRMIKETKPDCVIVTCPDAYHDDYIVRALDAGCDCITEKPLTTTPEKAQRIADACKRNNRHVRVLFNYRYSPPRTQVKDLLMNGVIGDVLSVDFQWLLNTLHGADYFRRWHSQKAISGGLMIHKSTHHFDLVNWWLGSEPEVVQAYGKREYYTPKMAQRMGLKSHHERCHTCPEKDKCTFFLDITADKNFKELYFDNEKHDGYFRDQCVFRPEIDIEDTMNVIVKYRMGATLSYSLNAMNAWEGYNIAFNGTKGRIEHSIVEGGAVSAGATNYQADQDRERIRVIPLRGKPQDLEVWTGTGGHGGGDTVMLNEVFGKAEPDKYKRAADERSGFYSILIGAAANRCFETGAAVKISDLVTGLTSPVVAPMPTRDDPVPMPLRS